jgi:hypothetical protein
VATECSDVSSWDGRFGTMLIEVVDGQVFVNGQQVLPADLRCS